QQAAALLWPEADQPRNNLRQQLARFRQALGRALLEGEDELRLAAGVAVAPSPPGVDLLAGEAAGDDDFGHWLRQQRAAASQGQADVARAALAQAEAAQDLDAALAAVNRWVAADPDGEGPRRELMRLHYLRGDNAAGLAAYEELARRLSAARGLRPAPATEQLAAALRTAAAPALPAPHHIAPVLLRPPRMVGRDAERDAVLGAWASQRAAFVLGEAGLGKSRLIAACMPADGLVVSARPGDASVPYATLARLLRPLLAFAGTTPPGRELARVLPELQPALPLPVEGRKLQLQQAVEQLLASAAPAAVALDDLHFADDASLDLLLSALSGEGAPPTRWLFAQRPAEGGSAAARLTEALEEAQGAVAVRLAPLSAAAMAELVDSLQLPGLDGAALAPELVRHTGGNPLFALETLKARWLQGGAGPLPRPASVGALIERRLRQLSPEALALARVAAVAGVDFDIDIAERLLGCSPLALADRWAELERAQVLRDSAFAHDLVFEATLNTLPRPVAARLHAELAALLETRASEPARIAEHWRAAGQPLRAVPHWVNAAETALGRYQAATAGDLLLAAADALQGAGQRAEAFALLGRCARAWYDLADEARLLALSERMDAMATGPAERARALLARGRLQEVAGDHDTVLRSASEAVAAAGRTDDRELLAEGLDLLGPSQYWKGRIPEALESFSRARALWDELGRARERAVADYNIGVMEHMLGRHACAEAAQVRASGWILQHGDASMVAHHLRELSRLRLDAGRFAEALPLGEQALQWLSRTETGSDVWCASVAQLASVLRHCGHYARALAMLDEYEARFEHQVQAAQWWDVRMERAMLLLALGRPELALQICQRMPAAAGDTAVKRMRQYLLHCQLVEAGAMPQASLTRCDTPREAKWAVALDRAEARLLPARERADALARVADLADSRGLVAEALGIRVEQLRALVDADLVFQARPLAEMVAAGVAEREPLVHAPLVGWALHGAWAAAAPERARAALERSLHWLADALDHHVPPPFLRSAMQRQPVNRAVLAAAAALPEWQPRLRRWQAAAEA
ncbi:MAG: AAA family ATPase, partial [Rubrivivax sp.]|nr:AAA family ATPase [Rubrivivax sp.]